MRYLLILLLLAGINCFGQDYRSQIADFRKKYQSDFLSDPSSPLKQADLQYLRFYDADSTYRVIASVEVLAQAPVFTMQQFDGGGRQYTRYALIKFVLKGQPMQLTVYRSVALAKIAQYKDYLFLPFTDETNGKETYGGGRYIDLNVSDFKDNTIVLDFNKAYNPYCAFSAGYSCPKPPDENQLALKIEAGEKKFARETGH